MTSEDPRYRIGTCEEDTVYLWYLQGSDTPAAGFLSVDGYVAFYDFEAGVCGSALSDINERVDWETFEKVHLPEINAAYPEPLPVVKINVNQNINADEVGISIVEVQESAYFHLLGDSLLFASVEERREIADGLLRFQ